MYIDILYILSYHKTIWNHNFAQVSHILIQSTFSYASYSVDNSEWMRNGDYLPSRIEAQQDAVNLICGMKTSPL